MGLGRSHWEIRMGDRILAVNTTDIMNVCHQKAMMSLLQPCKVIKLTIHGDYPEQD